LVRRLGLALLVLLAALVPGAPALAAGVLLSPATIEWPQALAGSEYAQFLYLAAPQGSPRTYALAVVAGSDESEWLSLAAAGTAPGANLQLTVDPGAFLPVSVKVAIPATAALGTHVARISVTDVGGPPAEATPSPGTAVTLRATVPVTIVVVGVRTVSGVVNEIRTDEAAEAGAAFHVFVRFHNTGTVAVAPRVAVDVSSDGRLAGSQVLDGSPVAPQEEALLTVGIDTAALAPGRYAAQTVVSVAGQQVASSVLPFSLSPPGTLPREGRLAASALAGEAGVGSVVRLTATFANAGLVELAPVLQADVFRDGTLVDTLQGDPLAVAVGTEAPLSLYYRVPEDGEYVVRLRAHFGDSVTPDLVERFAVAAAGGGVSAPGPAAQQPATTERTCAGQ